MTRDFRENPYVYIPGTRRRDPDKVPDSRQVDDDGAPISIPFPGAKPPAKAEPPEGESGGKE